MNYSHPSIQAPWVRHTQQNIIHIPYTTITERESDELKCESWAINIIPTSHDTVGILWQKKKRYDKFQQKWGQLLMLEFQWETNNRMWKASGIWRHFSIVVGVVCPFLWERENEVERKEKWNEMSEKNVEIDIPKTESWCATFVPTHKTSRHSERYLIIKPLRRWQQFHCCDTTKRSSKDIRTTDRQTHKSLNTTIITCSRKVIGKLEINWFLSTDPIRKTERQRKFDWMSMMTMLSCRLM